MTCVSMNFDPHLTMILVHLCAWTAVQCMEYPSSICIWCNNEVTVVRPCHRTQAAGDDIEHMLHVITQNT